jgi:hypothetical protein
VLKAMFSVTIHTVLFPTENKRLRKKFHCIHSDFFFNFCYELLYTDYK